METFYSEEECSSHVAEHIGGDQITPVLSEAVANALTSELRVTSTEGSQDSFEIKVGSWVIRDEDFNFFDILKDSALLYLCTKSPDPIMPSVIAFAVTLARLLWSFHRKGVTLSGDMLLVFTALRQSDDSRSSSALRSALGDDWTDRRVEQALELLSAVPSHRAPIELVTKLPDGRWIAHA